MSNTNDINFKGTGNDIDDTEGHGFRGPEPAVDDGARWPGTDTEGRWRRPPSDDAVDVADAEGHAAKAGRAATTGTGPGKPRVKF